MSGAAVLEIEDLRTYFYSRSKRAFIRSVDGVDLHVKKGETLGIVGESGSGKSVTAHSVLGLISAEPGVISGRVRFSSNGASLDLLRNLDSHVSLGMCRGRVMEVRKDNAGWQKSVDRIMQGIRGREIAMIFQNPKLSMNPFMTIGRQITEAVMLGAGAKEPGEAKERALYWLEQVKIDSPRLRYDNHPYGLSGGMCQRAMIAMALSAEPSLLIADEPTTGLDATIQSKIVELLAELKSTVGVTSLLISHDIDVVSRLSDNVAVMYGGTVMEYGPAADTLSSGDDGKHPYTAALLESAPGERHIRQKSALRTIEGDVLDTVNIPEGCRFFARCNRVTASVRENCEHHEPGLREVAPGHRARCWLYPG
jgi:oligopeptide/dipeptide ABC transporter ATP-binding protein